MDLFLGQYFAKKHFLFTKDEFNMMVGGIITKFPNNNTY